jgi:hypothetical protein
MAFMQLDVPFVATSLTNVTVTAPPQLSVAVTKAMFGAGTCEEALEGRRARAGERRDGRVVDRERLRAGVGVRARVSRLVGPDDRVVAAPVPLVGTSLTNVTVTGPPQMSVAVTEAGLAPGPH